MGQRWKHTATDRSYTIVTVGLSEATLSPVVAYECPDGVVWMRALAVFLSDNDEGKPRFTLLDDEIHAEQTRPFQRAS